MLCHGDRVLCHGDRVLCHRDRVLCHKDRVLCHGDTRLFALLRQTMCVQSGLYVSCHTNTGGCRVVEIGCLVIKNKGVLS